MLAVGAVDAVAAQRVERQSTEGLPLELALELGVHHVDVDVVIVQLREDAERGVVARVDLIGVQRARGVQRVAERVDVERAADGTRDHVGRLVERARSLLVAVARVRAQRGRQVLRQLVGGVDVGRVALHLRVLRPARVDHGRERGVERGAVGAAGDRHRVGLHDVVVEQQVEPVGVAELGLAQVVVHRLLGVGQHEVARLLVVGVHQAVHLAVQAGRRGVGNLRELQPALGGHLLVDAHLLLRVRDVVIAVGGLQAVGELARIVDRAVALAALLRGDDDHARHGARAIYRGGGTVLQHLERLDVVGVQAGDGVRDQRRGVARREVVGVDVDGVLHDHAVDHPQGRRRAVDRGGAAHADLRGRAERARHVLHRDAGGAALQGARNVGYTVELRLLCVDFRSCTGEQSLVHLLDTRDDDFAHLGRVRSKVNLHALLGRDGLCVHAHEAYHKLLSGGHINGKLTVHVGGDAL